MKYFLISTEMNNNPMPNITNWYKQINPRDIAPERAGNIPQWTLLDVNNGAEAIFSDVLSMPGYLVSSMIYTVLNLYNPDIQYRKMALFDKKVPQALEVYYLPILPVCNCLLPESELSRDKSKVIRGVIDLAKTRRRPVINLGGVTNTHIAFRLDVVESILRRGAKGIKLAELAIENM